MSRITWRFLLTLFVVAWALYELYPPTPRNLIDVFEKRVEFTDTNFTAIVQRARELEQQRSNQTFFNLLAAVGTNDLTRYFPSLADEEDTDPNRAILNRLQQKAAGRIKLGLDLQGGTAFLVQLDPERLKTIADKEHAVEQAMEVLRKRVDAFGVAEPILQPAGEGRILIQIPGMSEDRKQAARETIQKVAFLEFRLVHPESDELLRAGIIEPGYEVLTEKRRKRRDREAEPPRTYLVSKNAELGLTGAYVADSGVYPDPLTGKPKISLRFNAAGAEKFAEITRANVGRFLAIVLDGELQSAPRINEPILGGNCEISGEFDLREAFDLANVLRNPLETPVKIIEERSVDPSLGADSVRSGMIASAVAAAGTFVFMMVFYLTSGLVANLALVLNVLILLGAMCAMDATLTMPGIAGIALTIGMAVDANVLIYERMREEIAAGKSIRGVIAGGYDKAFGTIFDANLTTLIAALILYKFGTGPVKGFGITLSIGICVSMFTALLVTRLIYDFLLARGWISKVRMLPMIKIPHLPFMRWGRTAVIASALLILVGMGYGLGVRGKQVLGVDFAGGDSLTLSFTERVGVDELRSALARAGLGDASISYQQNRATGHETLQITVPVEAGPKAEAALKSAFPKAGFEVVASDSVGPTVGAQIQRSALIACLLAMFAILVYVAFRYEFAFAVGAVVALLHDVLVTLAVFFLVGGQLSTPMVAAILTVIGYSINDSIVIMDRIRENLRLGVPGSFQEIIDLSLNQTLSRTVLTSGTLIVAVLALWLLGSGVIVDLAFAILVGTIAGTYSSLLIASPIALWWHKGERPKLGAPVGLQTSTTPASPTAKATA
jgi:SecD/SecF fusion protein